MTTESVTVTKRAVYSAAEIAARMSPADMPGAVTESLVLSRMRSGRWPSTKLGRARVMTEGQFQQALDIEAIDATITPHVPRPSGVSRRSRHKRAS